MISIILYNCNIILQNKILSNYYIEIRNEKIFDIAEIKVNIVKKDEYSINLKGQYLAAGLIDIHTDAIERVVVPRKGIILDYSNSIKDIDKVFLGCGITTAYHSLSIANSTITGNKRTLSLNDFFNLARAIKKTNQKTLVSHKFHARLELNTMEALERLIEMINTNMIDQLSIMDHTPGQGQYSNIETYYDILKSRYCGKTRKELDDLLYYNLNRKKLLKSEISSLLQYANEKHIPLSYHDVDAINTVDYMIDEKISICEFPLSMEILKYAKTNKMYCVVGSPNLLRGSSHVNNLSAIDAIKSGYADIICSDYIPSTLIESIYSTYINYDIPLWKLFSYVTINPANAMNISKNYGSIEKGKIADLIAFKIINNKPYITNVFKKGKRVVYYDY